LVGWRNEKSEDGATAHKATEDRRSSDREFEMWGFEISEGEVGFEISGFEI
jgi:hypothetical protein